MRNVLLLLSLILGCDPGADDDTAATCNNGILDRDEKCDPSSGGSRHCNDDCTQPSYVFAVGAGDKNTSSLAAADDYCNLIAADANLPPVDYRAFLFDRSISALDRQTSIDRTTPCGNVFDIDNFGFSEACTASGERIDDSTVLLLSICANYTATVLDSSGRHSIGVCPDLLDYRQAYLCVAQE